MLAESENVSADSVFHLDAFLYDDELEQRLVEEGAIPRALCNKCGSKDTTPISKLINHHANSSSERVRLIRTTSEELNIHFSLSHTFLLFKPPRIHLHHAPSAARWKKG